MGKKICFFVNSMFQIGGEQRITTLISNEFVKNHYDVTIIIKCREKVDYSLYHLSKKIHLIFFNMDYDFRLNNISFFEKLRSFNRKTGVFRNHPRIIRHFFCSNLLLKKLKDVFIHNHYDIVIGVAGDRSFILSYLREYISGKLIFWNHMNFDAHFKTKNSRYYYEETFIEPLLHRFDSIVHLNENDVIQFQKYYHIDSCVIYNCKSFLSKKKSSLNHNRFVSCGRLVSQKGFEHLIEIMRIFISNNQEYELDIYGDGPLKEKLFFQIQEYQLEDFIHIHPQNRNIEKIFLNYDLYLNTSIHEGFGLTTIEALECGLPVFGFDIPANQSLIQNHKTGELISCYNDDEYANKLLEVVKDNNILSNYQKNIEKSIRKYNVENIIQQWIKIIEE